MLKATKIIERITYFFALGIVILAFFSCKKFVEIDPPPNELINANVFSTDVSATAAITGIYDRMITTEGFASGNTGSVTALAGLSADEFEDFSTIPDYREFANNKISTTNGQLPGLWNDVYNYIYTANVTLEGLNISTGVSDSVKKQLIGEAKFIRAFCYFYLTNLFGDVPLYTSSNYQTNLEGGRATAAHVYDQIESDLKDAQNLLSTDYSFSNGEKLRPNKNVATSLLGRAYLYQQKWDSAEVQASVVINSNMYDLPSDLNTVFLKNSSEAIWQLLPLQSGINTNEGSIFILIVPPSFVALDTFMLSAFEPGDARMTWVGNFSDGTNTWYFPYKYKVQADFTVTEYSMVLRLAEQYLVRAEARAEQNDFSGAQEDLNKIRNRAGLPNTLAGDQASLLTAILHERQIELFSEWGHRWLDLKRTNQVNTVLGTEKPGWTPSAALYPIPATEISTNPKMTQNPGY